jgi:hypothetical protein
MSALGCGDCLPFIAKRVGHPLQRQAELINVDELRGLGDGFRRESVLQPDQETTEPFSSSDFAGLKDVDRLGQLPGAPGAAAELAEDVPASRATVSFTYLQAVVVPTPNPAASSANVSPLRR